MFRFYKFKIFSFSNSYYINVSIKFFFSNEILYVVYTTFNILIYINFLQRNNNYNINFKKNFFKDFFIYMKKVKLKFKKKFINLIKKKNNDITKKKRYFYISKTSKLSFKTKLFIRRLKKKSILYFKRKKNIARKSFWFKTIIKNYKSILNKKMKLNLRMKSKVDLLDGLEVEKMQKFRSNKIQAKINKNKTNIKKPFKKKRFYNSTPKKIIVKFRFHFKKK